MATELAPVDLAAREPPPADVWCVCYGPRMASRAYYEDHTRALLQAELRHGRIVRLAALDPWPENEAAQG